MVTIKSYTRFREALSWALEHKDNSLMQSLSTLADWTRERNDVLITDDMAPMSLFFEEVDPKTGKRAGLCGGIIFHQDDKEGKHWRIHT